MSSLFSSLPALGWCHFSREVEARRRPIHKLPFMSFPIIVHTPVNTHNAAAKHEPTKLCLGIPVLESQNSGWPHCCRTNEWFVWSIWNKAFPISPRSSGRRSTERSRRWKHSRVFMVDFLPLPPWQQVTSCSSSTFVCSLRGFCL